MTQQKTIGLIGIKGAGKDTAASFLAARGYVRVAFADSLYREVADAFGVSVEFLGNREIKETPVPELALIHCADLRFVQVVLAMEPNIEVGVAMAALRSPRQIMQWWGTEYRRKLDDDSYWLNRVRKVIEASPSQNFVITDVRFPNEASFVRAFDGTLVRISRPTLELLAEQDRLASGSAAHPSETEMLNYPTDFTFLNEEGKPDGLRDAVLSTF